MRFRKAILAIPLGFFLIIFVSVLTLIIIFVWFSLWVLDVPNKLGRKLDLDDYLRRLLYRFVDVNEIKHFRDQFMEVIQPKVEYIDEIEEWGLCREIDLERERAINDLQQGEKIIAILGGVLTVAVGNVFGLGLGALALTVVTIFYSIAVVFRILVVDSLAYSSTPHINTPLRELAKMKTWNGGPLRGTGGVGVVIMGLITSKGSTGVNLGMEIMDYLAPYYFDYDEDKWMGAEDRER